MPLSRREWVSLCLWISGATRQQIGASLGVSTETARTYVKRLQAKRGLHSQADAIKMGADDDHPTRPI